MKIALLPSYLGSNRPEPVCFPIGLAYIASTLREHELLCWDPNVVDNPLLMLSRILERFEPDLVGVSLRNIDSVVSSVRAPPRSYYEPFLSTIRIVKETVPSSKLVVGGTGFSIFYREIMRKNPEIDFGVVSEGEHAILQLTKNLDHPERVKNVVTLKGGRINFTSSDAFVDFDSLPPPSTEGFDLAKYRKYRFSMGIQSKRGCSFRCVYCVNPKFVGRHFRLRSPKKTVDEIEEHVHKNGIRSFYFADPVFNFPPDHAREICHEISRRNLEIEWQADFRPDFINYELMMDAVKAGCEQFNFSPDGGSDEAMKVLRKNMDVGSIIKTANWASRIENARVYYDFVYDLPGGNIKHLVGLTRLLTKILSVCGSRVRFGFSKLRIYPYTPLHRIAVEQGRIKAGADLVTPVYYDLYNCEKVPYVIGSFLTGYSMILRKVTSMNTRVGI